MDIDKIVKSLTNYERVILEHLHQHISYDELLARSKLKEVELSRGLQWLSNKGLIDLKSSDRDLASLDKNGLLYIKRGLPERRLLVFLREKNSLLSNIKTKAGLSPQEINISLGVLRRKKAIDIKKDGKDLVISLTSEAKSLLEQQFIEERILIELFKKALFLEDLTKSHKDVIEELKKRKEIIKIEKIKVKEVKLTALGKQILSLDIKSKDFIESLTHEILVNKTYEKKEFRRYDILAPVPKLYGAKKHFVNQACDHIKKIWLEMGFKEMSGPIIDTSFWNFDALFVPQDHPAREMQDTFFINGKGKLPNSEIVKRVKAVHENGWTTGSSGWNYKWSEEEAKKLVLRTHTTVLSARTIAALRKEELPAKFFSVGKIFRNEAIDWAHLFELHQIEGIIIDESVNFKNLLGYLREYYNKLGIDKVKFRPSYYPYTEMSVDCIAYIPERNKWIELGGAGMFRPEVVKPLLGINVPVLAFGQGLERGILEYYKITDIRELYKNDLKQLREMRLWMK